MIAKIHTTNNLFGTVLYNTEKIDNDKAKIIGSNLIFEKNGNFEKGSIINQFLRHTQHNDRTKKPYVHISLNPHPMDILSEDQLKEIADEYMAKLGYEEQPYIIIKHNDIKREHLHIISTKVKVNGKKISDSNEKYRSKEITNSIEKKYKLHHTTKQTKEETEAYIPTKIDREKGNMLQQIKNILRHTSTYSFQSFNEYKTLLSLYNIEVQQIQGFVKEKSFKGFIYKATDDTGAPLSPPIKASRLGSFAGIENIEKKFIEKIDPKVIQFLTTTISEAKKNKEEDVFIQYLKSKGIDAIFRKNEEGRIYGATFIDNTSKTILNGSKLGKEFSANTFHKHFLQKEGQTTTHTRQARLGYGNNTYESDELTNTNSLNFGSIQSSLLAATANTNVAIYKKKKRKKKKKI